MPPVAMTTRRRQIGDQITLGVLHQNTDHATIAAQEVERHPICDLHIAPGKSGTPQRPHELDTGGVSIRVEDPSPAMSGLTTEQEIAAVGPIEFGAEINEPIDRFWTLFGKHFDDIRDGQPRGHPDGVCSMVSWIVLGIYGGSDATLRPGA